MKIVVIALLSLSFISSNPALAAKAKCSLIDAAISATEDFVEVALDGGKTSPQAALTSIHQSFEAIKPALTPQDVTGGKTAINAIDAALVAGDKPAAALAAMDAYKLLVAAFAPRLPTTRDVAMLDHAGFKFRALAATGMDWSEMAATAEENAAHWAALDKKTALADLMGDIQSGLEKSIAAKNRDWVDANARILLDSVDLVEASVKNGAPNACK